jgi:alginate O-acetyltransferase complex protein AlgI
MTFTSLNFFIFLAAVLIVYFSLSRWYRWQNILLLIASYVFYGFWDSRFLGLLFGLTVVNYIAGWMIGRSPAIGSRKRFWLILAIVFDLGVLGTFKYFNFFDENFVNITSLLGWQVDPITLKLILPLGISFFTFMALTYPFDIFRGKIHPTKQFLDYALFVSFFPTIISGPVERASHMLPQFNSPRQVDSSKINQALWLILWGFFQKLVIADNLAVIVNRVYNNYTQFQGIDLIIAIIAFTVQILADFGGYTDIARGVARLFGFELLINFHVPYFSLNPSDFWSRWHISLSQWFRDYLYIPLGGNRKGFWRTNINIFITMVLVGFWHGAAWTFIIWGSWHGIIQIIYRLFGGTKQKSIKAKRGRKSNLGIAGRALIMLILVAVGWAVFRATSFTQAAYIFSHLNFYWSTNTLNFGWQLFIFTVPMAIVQLFQFRTASPIFVTTLNPFVNGLIYGVVLIGIIIFSTHEISRFIYQGF